ncbi:LLM class flavin-dependent oxidoreductase [Amycolatopsis sp. FDAARGOS 1241]|uniref:LLM class flavin-dependent oxidoreductase n=1 Tax=Amycolatopsis sp. FDAARGOS 1241 TaxID=2778070 RepID=UPI001EF3C641|nr:LLM class flavin-dependent oxidoreductase [Amycolatopsis sp. FDAARGOS 1241]
MAPAVCVVARPDLGFGEFVAYVRQAKRLGFAELWVVEDCFFRGSIAQAAVALAKTERIRIGVGVLPAGARNPAFACLDLATLAGLFPGRLLVGIGHGMPEWLRQAGAWPASPLTLLREYFTTVRAILGGAFVTFDGAVVRLRDVRLQSPPAVVPPLFAGVRGPRSLAVAREVADGTILAEPVTPEYLRAVREIVGTDHELVAYNVAAVDDSPARPGPGAAGAGGDRRAGLGAAPGAVAVRSRVRRAARANGIAGGIRRGVAGRLGRPVGRGRHAGGRGGAAGGAGSRRRGARRAHPGGPGPGRARAGASVSLTGTAGLRNLLGNGKVGDKARFTHVPTSGTPAESRGPPV